MEREGPVLESLTRRLAETPEDFLAEPRIGASGSVYVPAVVGDVLRMLGGAVDEADLVKFEGADARKDRNRLAVVLLCCWLLADDWFRDARPDGTAVLEVLLADAAALAGQAGSRVFTNDPDRREELARTALARLGYRPAGETIAQAQDRLTTISSTERSRVLAASRAGEERARKIREALAKKAAQESADKWTRE